VFERGIVWQPRLGSFRYCPIWPSERIVRDVQLTKKSSCSRSEPCDSVTFESSRHVVQRDDRQSIPRARNILGQPERKGHQRARIEPANAVHSRHRLDNGSAGFSKVPGLPVPEKQQPARLHIVNNARAGRVSPKLGRSSALIISNCNQPCEGCRRSECEPCGPDDHTTRTNVPGSRPFGRHDILNQ
jgi:hypothetical protein